MRTSSAKAKGRRLQQKLRDLLLDKFQELKADDVRSTPMGCTGSDLMLSPLASDVLHNYTFECKNQETSKTIYDWYKQAKTNTKEIQKACLVISKNRERALAVIDLEDFVWLLRNYRTT